MITQPYRQLVLGDPAPTGEVSPATIMDSSNAVQLTVVASAGASSVTVAVQVSNDAQNWTQSGSTLSITAPGFYVMPAITGICTRYVRVACSLSDDGATQMAVSQHIMSL